MSSSRPKLFLLVVLVTILCTLAPEVHGAAVVNNTWFDWMYNYALFQVASWKVIGCVSYGFWGLLIWNDNGLMMERCLKTGGVGGRASFIGYDPK